MYKVLVLQMCLSNLDQNVLIDVQVNCSGVHVKINKNNIK